MVLGSVVVNLVDGDGGVGDSRLDGLLLNDRLDHLVNVVVTVLASNDGSLGVGVCGLTLSGGVSELGSLLLKLLLDSGGVAMVVLAVLHGGSAVGVLLGQNLAVLDGLDGGVVVVLVNLTVDGTSDVLVVSLVDSLVGDSGGNGLVDGSVVLAGLGHEVGNGSLSLVHCEGGLRVDVVGVVCGD